MKVVATPSAPDEIHYPASDGKPMGETQRHIRNMFYALDPVSRKFEKDDSFFVAANMFVYYVKGDPRKHVSPDFFAVKGVPKERTPERRKYMVWVEGKAPDVTIEFTSESTRDEDLEDKMGIYQDVLKVQEYFLFDPWDEYLVPRLQGNRLVQGRYQVIEPVNGRLPSEVLGLHLEPDGELLRFFDPATGHWLPIPQEIAKAQLLAEAERERAELARQNAETARHQAESEIERLRAELEEMRKRMPNKNGNG